MATTTGKGNEAELAQLRTSLTAALRKRDPDVVKKVLEQLPPDASVDFEPNLLAATHLQSCRGNVDPNVRCEACAISRAIWMCEMYEADEHVREFLAECGRVRQEIASACLRLARARHKFVDAEAPITRMRRDRWLAGERRRRAVPLRVKYALQRFLEGVQHLKTIPAALFPDDLFEDRQAAAQKRGRRPDKITNALVALLRDWMDLSDAKASEILGYSSQATRARRRRNRPGRNSN